MSQTSPSNKTLAKAVAVFGGAQAFSVLAAVVRVKFAAIFIGATGVGLTALYSTLTNLLSTLMGFGLANSSVPSLCQTSAAEQRLLIARLRMVGCLLALLSVPLTLVVSLFYSVEAMWLALPVSFSVLSCIEVAVMKSLKATRQLTLSLVATAIISVVFTVPFYIWMGIDGVIWAVSSTMTISALYTCWLGYRVCEVKPDFSELDKSLWGKVKPMFVLGLAFLISGVLAQGVDLLNQMCLESIATLAMVGLYKAGYQLSVTYTGMIFTAIANDFFPRLSSVVQDVNARNQLIAQQIRVLLMIVVPLIVVFVILVPWIVPLLFSDEFLPVVGMVRIAALSIIVKAIYMPMGYLPVALGKSWHFLGLEVVSWTLLAVGVLLGYRLGGLTGVGYGLLLSNLFDLVIVWTFCHHQYGMRLRNNTDR